MTAEGHDTAFEHGRRIGRWIAFFVKANAGRQFFTEMRVQHHIAPHQRRGAHVEHDRAVVRRKANTNRIGTQRRTLAADRQHTRLRAGDMKSHQALLDDLLDEVSVAARVIAVVNADRGETGFLRFFRRQHRSAVTGDVADVVRAIHACREWCFVINLDRLPALEMFRISGDGEDARQGSEAITAQRVVDQLIDHDLGVFFVVTDRLQGAHADGGGLGFTHAY